LSLDPSSIPKACAKIQMVGCALLLSLLLLPLAAFAGDSDPPSAVGPTNVYVAVFTNKIGAIKETEGQFGFDFYFYFTWRDDRRNATNEKFSQESHFFPSPELMNKASGEEIKYDCSCTNEGPPKYALESIPAAEQSGTWCYCMSRPQVTLDAELLLKAFPWDAQSADIIIESKKWQNNTLLWVSVNSSVPGLYPPGGASGVPGWNISATGVTNYIQPYPSLKEYYSALKLSLRLVRIPDYYITRYVWGVMFL